MAKREVIRGKSVSFEKSGKIALSENDVNLEKMLVENFVSLQKVMVNVSVKFDNLTSQISKLLELFEISAKSLAEKGVSLDGESNENKKIVEKLDSLINQNKILARGLTLLHEANLSASEKEQSPEIYSPQQSQFATMKKPEVEQYQKSISSRFNQPPQNNNG